MLSICGVNGIKNDNLTKQGEIMKPKKFNQKLKLNKSTVANLGNSEMQAAKGGIYTCEHNTRCSVQMWCSDPESAFALCQPTAMCTGPGIGCDTNDTCDTSIICYPN